MMRINFICPGTQKAATTTLYDILSQHPNVYLSTPKETFFYNREYKYKKGLTFYQNKYFSGFKNEKIVGEIASTYMCDLSVAEKIRNILGKDIKLIFMLRNPVDRVYSHYWHNYREGDEKREFNSIIKEQLNQLENNKKSNCGYLGMGLYSQQIKKYMDYFNEENFKFIIFEEFVKDIPKAMKEVFDFLEIDCYENINYEIKSNKSTVYRNVLIRNFYNSNIIRSIRLKIRNKLSSNNFNRIFLKKIKNFIMYRSFKKPKLDEETRKGILNFYKDDIIELEKLINRELDLWF
jgi:hypothetical protein